MRKGSSRMDTKESRTLTLASSSVSRKVPREWEGDRGAAVTDEEEAVVDGGFLGEFLFFLEGFLFGELVVEVEVEVRRGEAADNCTCERPGTL